MIPYPNRPEADAPGMAAFDGEAGGAPPEFRRKWEREIPVQAAVDEKVRKVPDYAAGRFSIGCSAPAPPSKTYKYKLPPTDEPVLQFRHFHFKLAVLEVLMYEKKLLKPEFDIWEFAAGYSGRRIDPEVEGYDCMVPEAAVWFQDYPVPVRLAPEVTEIAMDGGDEIYGNLAPNWDGEDDLFDIDAIDEAELRQFPCLQRASIYTNNEPSVVAVFRRCGIETVNAYDVPFGIDKQPPRYVTTGQDIQREEQSEQEPHPADFWLRTFVPGRPFEPLYRFCTTLAGDLRFSKLPARPIESGLCGLLFWLEEGERSYQAIRERLVQFLDSVREGLPAGSDAEPKVWEVVEHMLNELGIPIRREDLNRRKG